MLHTETVARSTLELLKMLESESVMSNFIDYGSVLKILSWFRNFDNFRTMG